MRAVDKELAEVHYLDHALSPRQLRRLERKTRKMDKQCSKNSHVPQSVVEDAHKHREPFNLLPKTERQSEQLKALETMDQVVCIGPAGTGKTYVTAAWAALQLDKGKAKKIVLTRPNVAAGPTLGLFPGNLQEKFANWIAPVTAVIKDVIGEGAFDVALKRGDIVYQPLETIRGMSYDNAIIIVDEAQNVTTHEMKALVTRVGEGSKLILDGDINQVDVKGPSGLSWAINSIDKSEYLKSHSAVVKFDSSDIVRSEMCKAWVEIIENE